MACGVCQSANGFNAQSSIAAAALCETSTRGVVQATKGQAIALQSEEVYERYMKYSLAGAEMFRIGYIDVNQFTCRSDYQCTPGTSRPSRGAGRSASGRETSAPQLNGDSPG